MQRVLGLTFLVCGSRTYWVIVALSSCDVVYFSAQLVGSFTLSDRLDKPWSQVSSLLLPGTCLQLLSCIGFSIPTARRFHRVLPTHALALSANHFFCARKSPYEYVHSVRIELAQLILVVTRITYQATGDAGYFWVLIINIYRLYMCKHIL